MTKAATPAAARRWNSNIKTYGLNPAALYSKQEVCEILHISPQTFASITRAKRLTTHRIGRKTLTLGNDIINLLNNSLK